MLLFLLARVALLLVKLFSMIVSSRSHQEVRITVSKSVAKINMKKRCSDVKMNDLRSVFSLFPCFRFLWSFLFFHFVFLCVSLLHPLLDQCISFTCPPFSLSLSGFCFCFVFFCFLHKKNESGVDEKERYTNERYTQEEEYDPLCTDCTTNLDE